MDWRRRTDLGLKVIGVRMTRAHGLGSKQEKSRRPNNAFYELLSISDEPNRHGSCAEDIQ